MAANLDSNPLGSMLAEASGGQRLDNVVQRALQVIRTHLDMQVAYVSKFAGNRTVFQAVDAPGLENMIKPGDSQSLDDVYCRHILAGRLPQLMPDTAAESLAAAMPITQAIPIGKHMSVPIMLSDGTPFGMFCCLGFAADSSLQPRDLQMMKAFADLAAFEINRDHDAQKTADEKLLRIKNVIAHQQISILYQPIWDIVDRRPIGVECLSRFSATPSRSPDKWFNEAAEIGHGIELELAAVSIALGALSRFSPDAYLAVNVSPETILSGQLENALEKFVLERIVLEVTEHAHVADYEALLARLAPLRQQGLRLAVDDAGAGYSSLQHILHLQPNLIKLDIALTRGIDLDPARRALAAALIRFARETGAKIIAEGVETYGELETLRGLGIVAAQGFFLTRPQPADEAVKLFVRDPPRFREKSVKIGGKLAQSTGTVSLAHPSSTSAKGF
jgi:EAL domain-containing protein (putative c-di-GMP-specific phosphodiesterase class I)